MGKEGGRVHLLQPSHQQPNTEICMVRVTCNKNYWNASMVMCHVKRRKKKKEASRKNLRSEVQPTNPDARNMGDCN